jgi:hypothetical protein
MFARIAAISSVAVHEWVWSALLQPVLCSSHSLQRFVKGAVPRQLTQCVGLSNVIQFPARQVGLVEGNQGLQANMSNDPPTGKVHLLFSSKSSMGIISPKGLYLTNE